MEVTKDNLPGAIVKTDTAPYCRQFTYTQNLQKAQNATVLQSRPVLFCLLQSCPVLSSLFLSRRVLSGEFLSSAVCPVVCCTHAPVKTRNYFRAKQRCSAHRDAVSAHMDSANLDDSDAADFSFLLQTVPTLQHKDNSCTRPTNNWTDIAQRTLSH